MHRDVLAFLRGSARKLLLTRAAESAAVGATAAGLCAAALEVAWTIAWSRPAAGLICAAASMLGGLAPAAFPAVRRALGLGKRSAAALSGLCLAVGAAGVAGILARWYGYVPKAALPLILLPAGAMVGALPVFIRGVKPRDAAIFLDLRSQLGERLSTAAELAESPRRNSPPARCVYAQALAAAARVRPERAPFWRRSRATAGALVLTILLCATLGLLPTRGAAEVASALGRLSPEAMTAEERQAFGHDIRRTVRLSGVGPELAEALLRAAEAVEGQDAERFRASLAELERQAATLPPEVARALLAAARQAAGSGGGTGGLAEEGNGGRATTRNASGTAGKGSAATVRVYHPAGPGAAARHVGPSSRPVASAKDFVPYDRAWSDARDRAAAALVKGRVPPQYRLIVRDFFLED